MSNRPYERNSVSVLCPFYIGKERNRIVCEGLITGTQTSISFANSSECCEWKTKYCGKDYNACGIAGMLNRKWGTIQTKH